MIFFTSADTTFSTDREEMIFFTSVDTTFSTDREEIDTIFFSFHAVGFRRRESLSPSA
jgi:hypothetical protein